jgi:hypothetical protein
MRAVHHVHRHRVRFELPIEEGNLEPNQRAKGRRLRRAQKKAFEAYVRSLERNGALPAEDDDRHADVDACLTP